MAVSAIDEAIRNAVAVGADPDRIAILDNFCWGNPTLPDRLGALVRACQGCYDGALAYRTPFISGKDSLYNEFNGKPIPGTLLISAIAIVPDMNRMRHRRRSKHAGNCLYLLGDNACELGGSLLYALYNMHGGDRAYHARRCASPATGCCIRPCSNGLCSACHDLSEGGLAVAAGGDGTGRAARRRCGHCQPGTAAARPCSLPKAMAVSWSKSRRTMPPPLKQLAGEMSRSTESATVSATTHRCHRR